MYKKQKKQLCRLNFPAANSKQHIAKRSCDLPFSAKKSKIKLELDTIIHVQRTEIKNHNFTHCLKLAT